MLGIMTMENPRWEEFVERLEGPEGWNFQEDGKGGYTWKCKAGMDKSLAIAILKKMGLVPSELSPTLDYFDANGGHCDCEILFNVDRKETTDG